MIRKEHFFYDVRELFSSTRLIIGLLAVAAFLVLFISLAYVYPFVVLFGAIFAIRGMIGRRCPQCDGPLKEVDGERDTDDAFTLYITWRCPRDGYEEKEKIKGDAGLFGVK